MTLALALAALGYLIGYLAGKQNGYARALEDMEEEAVIFEDPDSFLAVQRENSWLQ